MSGRLSSCELPEPRRSEIMSAAGRRSQLALAVNRTLDRKSLFYTSSNTHNTAVDAAGSSRISGINEHKLDTCTNTTIRDVVKCAINRGSGITDSATAVRALSVLPSETLMSSSRPSELLSHCPLSGSLRERGADPLRSMQPTSQLSFMTCSSAGPRISAGKRVSAPPRVEPTVSCRISTMQISPRLSCIADRSGAVARSDIAVGGRSALVGVHSPQPRVINSGRVAYGTYTRRSTENDGVAPARCAPAISSTSSSARIAAIRSEKSVLPPAAIATTTATPTKTTPVTPVSASSSASIHFAVSRTAAPRNGAAADNSGSGTRAAPDVSAFRNSRLSDHEGAQQLISPEKQARDADGCTGAKGVSRRLSFDDGAVKMGSNSLDFSKDSTKASSRVNGADKPEQTTVSLSANTQQWREESRTTLTPVRRPTAPPTFISTLDPCPVNVNEGVVTTTKSSADEVVLGKHVQENDVRAHGRERQTVNVSRLHSYAGAPVHETGQKPFIRESVCGTDSDRSQSNVVSSRISQGDIRFCSALRPKFDMCSGRYGDKVAQVKMSRCHSAGSRLLPASRESGGTLFNDERNTSFGARSRARASDQVGCNSHKEANGSSHAASLVSTTAGGRLERAERRPIPPASQWKGTCFPASLTAVDRASGSNTYAATTAKRASSTDAQTSEGCGAFLRGLKLASSGAADSMEPQVIPPTFSKDTETTLTFTRCVTEFCTTILQERDRRHDAEAGAEVKACHPTRKSGSMDVTSLCFSRCASGRIVPQSREWPRRADPTSQKRLSCPSVPLRRSATAPSWRCRMSTREETTCPIRAPSPTNTTTSSTASVLLRVRNVLDERRARIQASLQEWRNGTSEAGGNAAKAVVLARVDQSNHQQLKFNRGGGSGSGSSGGCYGISSSNTPGEMTERVDKSHERSEEEEHTPLQAPLHGDESHMQQKRYVLLASESVASPKRINSSDHHGTDDSEGNDTNHISVGGDAARRGEQHVDCDNCVSDGYEADYCDDDDDDDCGESSHSDEDPWWFFEYFWSGPAIVVVPPAFVPPLNFAKLLIPDDGTALKKYAIPLPTPMPLSPTRANRTVPTDFVAPPAFNPPHSSAACSGSRRRRLAEVKQTETSVEAKRERGVSVKILLLETAERRSRRLRHQEEIASRWALQEQRAEELRCQGL
ncbi:hypothetical protein, conserved [Trypanosoma brucei brucei TREU927]|uniref:Uncharacterized protein n=1 Tax=Trypanosoma brucei brucei (strain 927/4 GUTat10.1) TaxID=185431 RepID=Q57U60_TRYB2|nr:hypothetical protein, conserved [Trypanosoma brucei brucei TREU927]AAX70858.1 hypothetical protein, conserved [Trypanosoma brucei]AAZ13544.1 hypothetical protein, conserved [Trypanosoma brucei brucei TREU927]